MNLGRLRSEIHQKLAFYRFVERTMRHPLFPTLWEEASVEDRKKFAGHIDRRSKSGLAQWVKLQTLKNRSFDDWPMTKLRPFAKELGVPDYYLLRKSQLVWEIERKLDEASQKEAEEQASPEAEASGAARLDASAPGVAGEGLPSTPEGERHPHERQRHDGGPLGSTRKERFGDQ